MVEEKIEEKKRNATVTVTSGAWPIGLFREWDKDCIARFGNCRWMKMWHDHLAAKQLDVFTTLMGKLEELKFRIDKLEKKPPKEEEVLTLGRKENEEVKGNGRS